MLCTAQAAEAAGGEGEEPRIVEFDPQEEKARRDAPPHTRAHMAAPERTPAHMTSSASLMSLHICVGQNRLEKERLDRLEKELDQTARVAEV